MPIIRKYLAVLVVLLTFSVTAHAGIISVISADPAVDIGDQVQVDIVIDPFALTLVGSFDLNVNFDDTILSVFGLAFGTSLSDITDPFFLFQDALDLGNGVVNFAEISNLFDFTGFQDGDTEFLLARIVFDTVGIGTSDITLSDVFLTDDFSFGIEPVLVNSAVTVNEAPTHVPLPGSLWLMLAGLAALVVSKRTRKHPVMIAG